MAERTIVDDLAEKLDGLEGEGSEELAQPGYEAGEEGGKEEGGGKGEEKAKPEPEAEPAKPEPTKAPPSTVPYARFRELAEQRQEAQQHNETLQTQIAELRGQLTEFVRGQRKPPPDPAADPDAYIKHIDAEHARLQQYVRTTVEQQTQARQAAEQQARVSDYTARQVEAFILEQPDYLAAFDYLKNAVVQERIALGDSLQGAQSYFNGVAGAELERLYQTRGNPARAVYEHARRYGYGAPANGGAPQAGEAAKVSPEKAKKANRSIATAGRAAEVDLDSMEIESMSTSQFLEFVKRQKAQSKQTTFP